MGGDNGEAKRSEEWPRLRWMEGIDQLTVNFPPGYPQKTNQTNQQHATNINFCKKKPNGKKWRAWKKVQFSWVVTLDDGFFLDELCDPIVEDFQKVESEVSNKSAVSCWKLAIFSASRLLDHRCCDEYSLHHLFWFKDKDSSNFLNSVYVFLLQLDIYSWTSITTLHKSLLDLAFAMFSAFFLGQFLLSDSSHRWSGQVSLHQHPTAARIQNPFLSQCSGWSGELPPVAISYV